MYNLSKYEDFHPGGVPELMRAAGKDGSQLFDEVHHLLINNSLIIVVNKYHRNHKNIKLWKSVNKCENQSYLLIVLRPFFGGQVSNFYEIHS